jgi:hypothetical protein
LQKKPREDHKLHGVLEKIDGDKKGKDSWQSTHEHFGYHNGIKIFLEQNFSIKLVRDSSSRFKVSLVIISNAFQIWFNISL